MKPISRLTCLGLAAIAAMLGACRPEAAPDSTAPSAASDRPESADRIVALTSLSADILYHLDQERLVGIPGSSLLQGRPEFSDLTVVSQGRTPPQLETIVALEPDLVIGARGFHDQALAQLEATGIPVLATETNGWEDFEQLTQTLASLTQTDAAALEERYAACTEAAPASPNSVLVLVSRQPLLSPNAESWAGDLLERFGTENLTADMQGQSPVEGYVTLSGETVLEADPEVLILVDAGDGAAEQMQSEPFWGDLSAVQTNQVHVFDYYGLVNPGSLSQINAACRQLAGVVAEALP